MNARLSTAALVALLLAAVVCGCPGAKRNTGGAGTNGQVAKRNGSDPQRDGVAGEREEQGEERQGREGERIEGATAAAGRGTSQEGKAKAKAGAGRRTSQEEIDRRRTAELAAVDWPLLRRQLPPLESREDPLLPTRILLLAPEGPLIVDLLLTINGRPHDEPMQRIVGQFLRLADTDGDGRPTWAELMAEPRFRSGQYGNVDIQPGQEDQFRRMYDSDLDGLVDASELPRVLTRNAGRARPFSIRSANYYLENNRINSPARRLLDVDRDGQIDSAEAARGATRLRSRDGNQDDILTADELAGGEQERPPLLSQRISNHPDAVAALADVDNWARLLFSIRERYEAGYSLLPDSFRLPGELFSQLDQDGDQEISAGEASRLAELPPHIRLQVNFGARPQGRPLVGELWLCQELRAAGATIARHPQRAVLTLPGTQIEWFAVDAVDQNLRQRAAALVAQYDGNRDGYLEEDELPEEAAGGLAGQDSFADYDADGDGRLYEAELQAALEMQSAAQAGQIRSRAGFFSDALFAALDADHDGRLTTREMDGVERRVAELDSDGDGRLAVDEIPDSMLVGFVRGDPQQDQQQLQPPRTRSAPLQDVPRWFAGMDRNADGELSRAEFLGDRGQFARLDLDQDGYVSGREAVRESAEK